MHASRPENGEAESDDYDQLLMLDELESLLEDLDEAGESGSSDAELRERMAELDVADVPELRTRIANLHRQLDRHERGGSDGG